MFSALFLTVWFILAAMSAAHADPLSGAIATALLGSTAAGSVLFTSTVAILNFSIGVGLNYAAQALLGKKSSTPSGYKGTLQSGGIIPRSFHVGEGATAGSLIYGGTWGKAGKTPNAYLSMQVALGDRRLKSLVKFWVNDADAEIDYADASQGSLGFPVKTYKTGNKNHMWVRFSDGTHTGADAFMREKFAADQDYPYTADMIGYGVPYAIVTVLYEPELFTGPPAYKFGVEGGFWYDPRKDSTNGGSGPHRWSDESTWEYSRNPMVILYNVLRGMMYGGKWFYGLQGLVAQRLPNMAWFIAMNECDALVPSAMGGMRPQYQCGGEISVETPVVDTVQALLTACNGRLSENGGVYKPHVGAANAPVIAITDDDFLSTSDQDFDPFPSLSNTINGISATFPNKNEAFAPTDAPALYNEALENEDGQRRLATDVKYDLVPYSEQVQQLMKAALAEARRFRKHSGTLPPWADRLEPNDTIAWTSERNGYLSKLFRLDGITGQAVVLSEVDPSDYDWNPGTDYKPIADNPVVINFPQPVPILDWFAEPDEVTDNSGTARRPAIKLSWDASADTLVDVRGIKFEVRLASTLVTIHEGRTDQPSRGSIKVSQGLLPNTNYQVRGEYIPFTDRATLWSDWLAVRTRDIRLGADDILVELKAFQQDAKNVIDGLIKDSGKLHEKIEKLATDALQGGGENVVDRQVFTEQFESAFAQIIEEKRIRASETGALAEVTTSVKAQMDDPATGLKAVGSGLFQLSGRVDRTEQGLAAVSEAMLGVETSLGNVTASGLISFQAQIPPPAGVLSQINILARASTQAQFIQSGFVIQVYDAGGGNIKSKILVLTDRLTIWDGTNQALPFVFEGGVAKLAVAHIKELISCLIHSPDNKFMLTVETGTFEWYD